MRDRTQRTAVTERPGRARGPLQRAARSTTAATVTLIVVWALVFPVLKIGLDHVAPEIFAAGRAVVSSLVLLPVVVFGRRLPPDERRYIHRMGLILGLLNATGLYGFQSWGIHYISSGLGAMLLYAQPLLMAAGARVFFHEHLDARRIAGLALGWLGIALVLGGGRPNLLGVALTLAGAATWAAGSLVFKRVPLDVPLLKLLFWQNAYGALPLVVIALLVGHPMPWGDPVLLTTIFYVGAMGGVAGFGLLFILLRSGDAAVVGARIFAVPILGAALGVVLLHEPLTLGLVIGGIGVAAGIRLVNTSEPPPPGN